MTNQPPTLDELDSLLESKHGLQLKELIDDIYLKPGETLMWSGSWVEGFANSRSDVDLYLLGDVEGRPGKPELTAPGLPNMRMALSSGQVRLDITVVPREVVSGVGALLAAFDGDLGYPTQWSPDLREFIHRLKIGVPVLQPEVLEAQRDLIDFDKFTSYLRRFYHNRADSLLEDVIGLLDEGDAISAVLVARQRLAAVVDLYLATHGETNTRVDKWRWKKLNRLHHREHPLLQRYLEAERIGSAGSGAEPRGACEAILVFADDLLLQTL
ncbi:hypothetical protein ACFCXH_00175 [Streptomyces nojiriensis]|uniref:hypothetical protein n=1 Tax=Streptomyces nojiriensis TaxID=66374 RepID=UPI0035DE1B27